jgi:hypothetical protein
MRLVRVDVDAFRHFLDEKLDVDPSITAIVGRNDTGKTSLLSNLFEHFYGIAYHARDNPNLPNHAPKPVRFSLVWQTESRDDQSSLQNALNFAEHIHTIKARFDASRPRNEWWTYGINDTTTQVRLKDHSIFPRQHYVSVGTPLKPMDRDLLPAQFNAQLKEQGPEVERLCRSRSIPAIRLDRFACDHTGESAIEDVIGVDDYIARVNEFYSQFEWFQALDTEKVRHARGGNSLGRHLDDYFRNQWQQSFSKVAVAIRVALNIGLLGASAQTRLFDLIQEILQRMPESI